jgi:virginiamycin A acetyltransferase
MSLDPGQAGPPDPDALFPMPGIGSLVFLRPLLARHPEIANVSVGRFSYYSDFGDPLRFFVRNVAYNFGFSGARLEIGSYCQIAHGASFLMSDANHAVVGPSTFPFSVFGGAWADAMPAERAPFLDKGDIRIGHDVWLGHESLVLAGVTIGTGAIVAARAVVSRDVPPYAVVAGNPARVVRQRFDPATVSGLLELAWWDWPPARVSAAVPALMAGDLATLRRHAP